MPDMHCIIVYHIIIIRSHSIRLSASLIQNDTELFLAQCAFCHNPYLLSFIYLKIGKYFTNNIDFIDQLVSECHSYFQSIIIKQWCYIYSLQSLWSTCTVVAWQLWNISKTLKQLMKKRIKITLFDNLWHTKKRISMKTTEIYSTNLLKMSKM